MTTIKVRKNKGKFVSVEVSGHSDYSYAGNDIVCSAVSSVIQTAGLGLTQLVSKSIVVEINEKKPSYRILIKDNLSESEYSKADLILSTAILGLNDIALEYPKNLKMEVTNND